MRPEILFGGIGLLVAAVLVIAAVTLGGRKKQKKKSGKRKWGTTDAREGGVPAAGLDQRQRIDRPDRLDERYRFDQTVVMDQAAEAVGSLSGGPMLQYLGTGNWPAVIRVTVQPRNAFTIGRVDVVLGRKNCNFEFPPQSAEISRRHAAILRDEEGYIIQDLGSSAGTYANGVRLQPHVYYRLEDGCLISFGAAGADYCWKEV